MTFEDSRTDQLFPQHFCSTCFDEILFSYPEVSQELKDAEAEARPATIKSPPLEWIPQAYQELIRRRRLG
jgi:hypothetical protein